MLKDAGCDRPRIKVLPALPLGRELTRIAGLQRDECVTTAMLDGFDRDLLMCSNSRLVTDRGVWVCPLLVEQPDARLGTTLGRGRELVRAAAPDVRHVLAIRDDLRQCQRAHRRS